MNAKLPWFVLVVVATWASGLSASAAEGDAASPAIRFRNGDYAAGRLLDSPEASAVSWQAEGFARPLQFALSGVHSMQFPLGARPGELAGPFCFELSGGDALAGRLVSLDGREAVLEIAGLGTLHVARAALHRFYRTAAADVIFVGPGGLEGWTTSGPEKAWRDEAGQLQTNKRGAAIRRDFRSQPLTRYEFELSWSERPSFELTVGARDDAQGDPGFRIETWGDELVVTRESGKQGDVALLQKLGPGAGQLRLSALFDQPQGRLLVYSASGENLADFTVPYDKSAATKKTTKANPSRLLQAAATLLNPPGGVHLLNRRGDIKLQRLSINRWSGIAPAPAAAGMAAVNQIDGTIHSAEVRAFDEATRQLTISKDGVETRVDERQLQDVVLSQPGEAPGRAALVLLAGGTRVSGELSRIQQESLTLKSPDIQEPLVLPVKDLQAVLILKAEPPAQEAEASTAREAKLELAGVSLMGRLVDAAAGGESCLVFKPRYGMAGSPLAVGASGRLVLREPPPLPKPKPVAENAQPQPPAFQVLNRMRTMLGVPKTPSSLPAAPGDCLLHLRSGDTLPCRVEFVDERGVTFKSTATDAVFVPHERIKALELRTDSRPVSIEKAKFERLLTLPRMQRDNPPEHLIRSLEGDYLRGRLLGMNDKELQVEMRLETKTIERTQVSRILWLHPDESSKATVAKPAADQTPEKLPEGIRVQSVPRGGNRLTFYAQEFSGKTLSGRSEALGACRVDLEQIDQLLIGGAIEEASGALAFHQWKLRPSAEPLPDPEPGADTAGGAGMESVLVGKPAPAIELDLLDGKKFRLADCKDKIVVLDFWASWCGPCLQAMPQVDAVAREFADKGVQLVAINLEETPEKIKTALERLKLETTVALDRDGRIAERYGATAIPQTVIIDREGKVARLFIGGGARFDEQLRQALRSVLNEPAAGKPTE